jgi:hypothetical protein
MDMSCVHAWHELFASGCPTIPLFIQLDLMTTFKENYACVSDSHDLVINSEKAWIVYSHVTSTFCLIFAFNEV